MRLLLSSGQTIQRGLCCYLIYVIKKKMVDDSHLFYV